MSNKPELEMAEEELDLIDIQDEEGNTQTFEVLDMIAEGNTRYLALLPYDEEAKEEAEEFVVLKIADDDTLSTVDDEEELDRVGAIFIERMEELYGEE